MKLENQVCSLELSQKLLTLGVKQESYFSWLKLQGHHHVWPSSQTNCADCSAFTVAELGEMLPDSIKADKLFNNGDTTLLDLHGHFIKSSKKDDEYKIYIDGLTKCTIFFSKNEANARAKMLIYLIENKLLTLE